MSESMNVTRRGFIKGAAAGGAAAAVGAGLAGCNASGQSTTTQAAAEDDEVVWGHCSPNCYGRCPLRLHVKDGKITKIEADNTGDDPFEDRQIRACQHGRSLRQWINNEDRLKYPLRRTGDRGSGEFEQISWDEAAQTIADNYRRILDTYGAESVFAINATGTRAKNIQDFLQRFLNLNGGCLINDGGYSAAQIKTAMPYLYGGRKGNYASDVENSKLVVLFGDNCRENKLGGSSDTYNFQHGLEAGGAKVYVVDTRFTPTAATFADEWIPIRPGTDAALVDAMAYVMITEDLVDHDFLQKYTLGYDENNMPEGVDAKESYKAYISGEGEDKTAKTPAWASAICGVPEQRIIDLAREIATTKPCCVEQGLGPQRQENGEQTCRAICMLEILTGNVGIKGGGTGDSWSSFTLSGFKVPQGKNPIKTKLPTFMWTEAVDHGTELTKTNAGISGADKLNQPIKMIWNYAGNSLTNQHGNVNRTHQILSDTSKCEFIVTWEVAMTDSAKWSDIVLPDLFPCEQPNYAIGEYNGNMTYAIMGPGAGEPQYERKTLYQSLALIADKMGEKEDFTKGLDEMGWLKRIYTQARNSDPALPPFDKMMEMGVYRRYDTANSSVAYASFIEDPEKHPLKTDSGLIEIYSKKLADIAAKWELPEGDKISPLPVYVPAVGGYEDRSEEFPLQMIGFQERGHVHSSFHSSETPLLGKINTESFWINTKDAAERDIKNGDEVLVRSAQGTVKTVAKVTDCITPGVTALANGHWFQADENGVDVGGDVNTLVSSHPSPLAKAIPAHTNLVEVMKA